MVNIQLTNKAAFLIHKYHQTELVVQEQKAGILNLKIRKES
jgi:hypothetical protein